ncbi:hypothetical protein [Actinocorallia populi]|uniref:hypothetical protein n=1 Tax=Actinocorallia populi TaxID=2079200 RepID=UPI000D087585|nr:hypothetical protein [Actinocorallia populi]
MKKMHIPLAASAVLLAPLVVSAPAEAAGTICSVKVKAPKFQKVIDVQPGGVRPVSAKRPYGALAGRWAKYKKAEYNDGYYKPYGKKRTRAFAKKATICVFHTDSQGRIAMRKTGLKGLRKAVDKPKMNPQWGLRFDGRGKITLAYQVYHP